MTSNTVRIFVDYSNEDIQDRENTYLDAIAPGDSVNLSFRSHFGSLRITTTRLKYWQNGIKS
jgi:hypothetical protein